MTHKSRAFKKFDRSWKLSFRLYASSYKFWHPQTQHKSSTKLLHSQSTTLIVTFHPDGCTRITQVSPPSTHPSLSQSPTKTANFYLFHLHCHAIPTFSSLCAANMQRKPWIFTQRLSLSLFLARLHQVHTINRHCAPKTVENLLREN